MSFFISVLHRVNFSVYSRSVFLCSHLLLMLGQRSFGRLGNLLEGLIPNIQLRER